MGSVAMGVVDATRWGFVTVASKVDLKRFFTLD